MAAKTDLTSRLGKWAAIMPLILVLWAIVSWGLTADADIKTLKAHDAQLNATDRLARLEKGQEDTNKHLDQMQVQLDVILRQTK